MARGRRRAPVAPAVVLEPADIGEGDSGASDVDDFVAERHRKLAAAAGGDEGVDDDGSDLGIGSEAGVMDIAVSDSSEEDEDEDDSGSESEGEAGDRGDEDTQWGGRRRAWYGGDTHEYEIMEDEEREAALRDEEEEARRLQTKALTTMSREDFLDSDDDEDPTGSEEGDEGTEEGNGAEDLKADAAVNAAPELPALLLDLKAGLIELSSLKKKAADRKSSGATAKHARLMCHVLTSYATNIAFYLALRTDPDAAGVDVRSHPVIREIVRLRALRNACEGLVEREEKERVSAAPAKMVQKGRKGRDVEWEVEREALPSMEQVMAVEKGPSEVESARVEAAPVKEKKKKKRGKRKRKSAGVGEAAPAVAGGDEDEAFMRKVVGEQAGGLENDEREKDEASAVKRQKLNRVVGALERDRQTKASRRAAPADMQTVRQEPVPPKVSQLPLPGNSLVAGEDDTIFNSDGEGGDGEDDDVFMQRMLAKKEKKERKLARKSEAEVPHKYKFDDSIKDKDLRRRASSQVVHNRGLTRYRPRDRKTPRAKNREAFSKAVKKRASVVREPVAAKPSSYGGEASGINMRARKSSRLADV